MASTKPVLIFTLVHGTFAQGAPWVTDDGKTDLFRSRLRAALQPQFDVQFDQGFTWGYKPYLLRPWDNTLSARKKGGDELTGYLKKLPDVDGARRYLVAHSHGGNVALHALKDEAALKKVSGLICLATPCLFSKRAPFRRDLLGFSAVALFMLTLQWWSRLPFEWAIALWSYTIIYSVMFLLIFVYSLRTTDESVASYLEESKVKRVPSVWFLRVPEDEVGLLMSFSYRVGRGFRRSWQLMNQIGAWFLWAYVLTIMPARFLSEQLARNWAWLNQAAIIFDRIMTPIVILATPFLMAMVILRLSFAFDSIRWVPALDTWSEQVPWPDENVELVKLDPQTRGWLRHTKIHGPATERIAELVRSQFSDARQADAARG